MLIPLMVYIRLVLFALVVGCCFFGDSLVDATRHPLLRALADNGAHALIGALTAMTFVFHFYDRISNVIGWLIIFGCFMASSFIDLDHFIEARTFSLELAVSLTYRPFLHCSTIPLVLLMTYVVVAIMNYFKTSLALATLCCAFITHHSRDAYRRGFWFCPFGVTEKLPYIAYIIITVATPYMMYFLFLLCRSNNVQNILGGYVKQYDGISRSASKYSIV